MSYRTISWAGKEIIHNNYLLLKMADKKDEPVTGGKRTDITVVAEDKNWRSYVANELSC